MRVRTTTVGDLLANRWQTAVRSAPGTEEAGCWTGPGLLVWVEPPAGIEPATPSLPSMRGWFTTPRNTSRDHTTTQVKGAVEG